MQSILYIFLFSVYSNHDLLMNLGSVTFFDLLNPALEMSKICWWFSINNKNWIICFWQKFHIYNQEFARLARRELLFHFTNFQAD